MSLRKIFRGTTLSAVLGVSLLGGIATPAHADRDDRCERNIRKAQYKLDQAIRKRGERSRQAEKRRRNLHEIRERCHWDRDRDRDRR